MFIVILVIGLGLLVYGVYALLVRIKFVPKSKIITGTVINLHATSTRKGRTAYFPVIEYYNTEIEKVESFEHSNGNERSKYNIGDGVELKFYSGEGRKIVLINTWSGIWLAPIAFIIAGLIFITFGLLMILI